MFFSKKTAWIFNDTRRTINGERSKIRYFIVQDVIDLLERKFYITDGIHFIIASFNESQFNIFKQNYCLDSISLQNSIFMISKYHYFLNSRIHLELFIDEFEFIGEGTVMDDTKNINDMLDRRVFIKETPIYDLKDFKTSLKPNQFNFLMNQIPGTMNLKKLSEKLPLNEMNKFISPKEQSFHDSFPSSFFSFSDKSSFDSNFINLPSMESSLNLAKNDKELIKEHSNELLPEKEKNEKHHLNESLNEFEWIQDIILKTGICENEYKTSNININIEEKNNETETSNKNEFYEKLKAVLCLNNHKAADKSNCFEKQPLFEEIDSSRELTINDLSLGSQLNLKNLNSAPKKRNNQNYSNNKNLQEFPNLNILFKNQNIFNQINNIKKTRGKYAKRKSVLFEKKKVIIKIPEGSNKENNLSLNSSKNFKILLPKKPPKILINNHLIQNKKDNSVNIKRSHALPKTSFAESCNFPQFEKFNPQNKIFNNKRFLNEKSNIQTHRLEMKNINESINCPESKKAAKDEKSSKNNLIRPMKEIKHKIEKSDTKFSEISCYNEIKHKNYTNSLSYKNEPSDSGNIYKQKRTKIFVKNFDSSSQDTFMYSFDTESIISKIRTQDDIQSCSFDSDQLSINSYSSQLLNSIPSFISSNSNKACTPEKLSKASSSSNEITRKEFNLILKKDDLNYLKTEFSESPDPILSKMNIGFQNTARRNKIAVKKTNKGVINEKKASSPLIKSKQYSNRKHERKALRVDKKSIIGSTFKSQKFIIKIPSKSIGCEKINNVKDSDESRLSKRVFFKKNTFKPNLLYSSVSQQNSNQVLQKKINFSKAGNEIKDDSNSLISKIKNFLQKNTDDPKMRLRNHFLLKERDALNRVNTRHNIINSKRTRLFSHANQEIEYKPSHSKIYLEDLCLQKRQKKVLILQKYQDNLNRTPENKLCILQKYPTIKLKPQTKVNGKKENKKFIKKNNSKVSFIKKTLNRKFLKVREDLIKFKKINDFHQHFLRRKQGNIRFSSRKGLNNRNNSFSIRLYPKNEFNMNIKKKYEELIMKNIVKINDEKETKIHCSLNLFNPEIKTKRFKSDYDSPFILALENHKHLTKNNFQKIKLIQNFLKNERLKEKNDIIVNEILKLMISDFYGDIQDLRHFPMRISFMNLMKTQFSYLKRACNFSCDSLEQIIEKALIFKFYQILLKKFSKIHFNFQEAEEMFDLLKSGND